MSSEDGSEYQKDIGRFYFVASVGSFKNVRTKEVERNDTVSHLPVEIESAKSWVDSLGSLRAKALGFICRLDRCQWNVCQRWLTHDLLIVRPGVCGDGLERVEMACFVNSFTYDILKTIQGKN